MIPMTAGSQINIRAAIPAPSKIPELTMIAKQSADMRMVEIIFLDLVSRYFIGKNSLCHQPVLWAELIISKIEVFLIFIEASDEM